MTSGTVSSFFLLFVSCTPVLAQSRDTQQVQFNQVLNVNGDMALNSFQFPDRSKIETFSQKQQQIFVNQQTPAIPANQVTGTTGQPFVQISPQSMTISTNGATDLVGGQIEMAMSQQNLQAAAVQPDNTYVAMLSPDRQTWMIQETMRMVNGTDMTVRMVKRAQLDGEYMIVGRQTVETNTLVQPFGSSIAVQGTGLQENEYQDGFRMSTRATQPVTMVVDVKKGVDSGMVSALTSAGQTSVNDYRYSVKSNLGGVVPNLNQQVTVVQMPINAVRIQKMMQAMGVPPNGQVAIAVAQRGVLQNPGGATGNLNNVGRSLFRKYIARQVQAIQEQQGQQGQQIEQGQQIQQGQQTQQGQQEQGQQNQQGGTPTTNNPVAAELLLAPTFTPIQNNAVLDQTNMRIAVPVREIDGEFILTMQKMGGTVALQPAEGQQGQGQGTPEARPTPAEGATPPARESSAPARAGGETPSQNNGTATAGEPGKTRPERRQEAPKTDKYGQAIPPKGAVIMTMKMVDDMVAATEWGGQAAITEMMQEYVKSQTGQDLFTPSNGTEAKGASALKLIA